MSKLSKRCLELSYRKSVLEGLLKKTEEEMKNKAMIMLAKTMDEDIEHKLAGSLTMTKNWLKDIDEEIDAIGVKLADEMELEWKNRVFNEMDKESKKEKE